MIDQDRISKEFDQSVVYIKQVDASYLSEDVLIGTDDPTQMFAVHGADGSRLALVANRQLAVRLARENELVPVSLQ